jgi:hypothetical protein
VWQTECLAHALAHFEPVGTGETVVGCASTGETLLVTGNAAAAGSQPAGLAAGAGVVAGAAVVQTGGLAGASHQPTAQPAGCAGGGRARTGETVAVALRTALPQREVARRARAAGLVTAVTERVAARLTDLPHTPETVRALAAGTRRPRTGQT